LGAVLEPKAKKTGTQKTTKKKNEKVRKWSQKGRQKRENPRVPHLTFWLEIVTTLSDLLGL
jgi:hypothetical protein